MKNGIRAAEFDSKECGGVETKGDKRNGVFFLERKKKKNVFTPPLFMNYLLLL